jgi:YHS domain-containing protein
VSARCATGSNDAQELDVMIKKLSTTAMLAAALVVAAAALVLAAGEGQRVNRASDGLALDGYDPVAYFVDGTPVRGSAAFEQTIDGTRYRFVSAENRDRFAAEPAKYLPQYGGFCAWAVSRGYTANGDPLAWRIVDGRLFLNYSKRVQRMWEEDVPGNITKGDANWPAIRERR